MDEKIDRIVELDIDFENLEMDDMGVEVVSLVTEPAIEVDFLAFSEECDECVHIEAAQDTSNLKPYVDQDEEFESYGDYPDSVKNNAKRGIELNEKVNNKCATQVGKVRAQQLAKGEKVSMDTIQRMYSYLSRAETYYDPSDTEACGTISYLLWGGKSALPWAKRKLKEAGKLEAAESMSFNDEIEEIILQWAEEYGEAITEDYTIIKEGEEFANIGDIASAIQGLDILGKMGIKKDEPAETRYRYTGPSAERGFCKAMTRLNKLYSESDMDVLRGRLSSINPNMGPRGANSYDVFAYKGGVNCRHFWTKNSVFKPEGSRRVLVIDQGPAAGNAGKSNNANSPSPTGSVRNNASLRFGFAMDDEKRIVAGPLMIPNQMILRRNQNGEAYYVYFSQDTVKKIQERFNKEMKINNTDTQHDGNVHTENVLLEQWIIESRIHDKSKFYGFDNLPNGTWFGVYKINNDEDWERIKSGELKGFSVAGNFLEKAKPLNEDETTLSEIIKILRETK